jgi:signal transduction histidine kinase
VTVLTSTVDGAVGRYAQLVVANTGPVIEPATVAGLFEPFRRLQDRTASDGVGCHTSRYRPLLRPPRN